MNASDMLAGRLAAQDRLIAVMMGALVQAGAVTADNLAGILERAAEGCGTAPHEKAEAMILRNRAEMLRSA